MIRRKFRSESDVDRRRFANRKLGFLCFPGYQIEAGASSPSPSSRFNRLQAISSWRVLFELKRFGLTENFEMKGYL
jgi:hypothetical protein